MGAGRILRKSHCEIEVGWYLVLMKMADDVGKLKVSDLSCESGGLHPNKANRILPVERVSYIDRQTFKRCYLQGGRPLVLTGFANKWQAAKWTLESLKERVGENEINVRRNTDNEDYKVGQKYNIEKMKFKDYIDNIMKGSKKAKSSYMAVQNIKQAFPQLESEIEIPEFVEKMHAGPFLWIANRGHYEFCHFDPDDNCLLILSGKKRVKLFGCDLNTMYPNRLGSKGRTIQSQVFVDEPDYEKFPNFRDSQCFECILESGDLLFFPAFWWHQVTSLETTISVNMFFGDSGDNVFLTKIMTSYQWGAFQHWLLNIIEQNRETMQFKKVLEHLQGSIKAFLLKQWHEIPSSEQLEKLIFIVKEYLGIKELPVSEREVKHAPPLKIRGLLWRS